MKHYDVAIIGSGASGGAVAYSLTKAGYKVALIEKGRVISRDEFSKDELAYTRRDILTPNIYQEYHILEYIENGKWVSKATNQLGSSFFNGNMLGGSSNLMSGMFHRMHPDDFKLGDIAPIQGANIQNWAIDYSELEPYYDKAEELVGISGRYTPHRWEPPRKHKEFRYPPLAENKVVKLIDKSCQYLGIEPLTTPRAILSQKHNHRDGCYYSGFCGSYGCSSGAKGSSLEAFIIPALQTNNLDIYTNTQAIKLHTSRSDKIEFVECVNTVDKKTLKIYASAFVLSAQAHESVRLMLNSASKEHPDGLANSSKELGKNLIFSAGGVINATLSKDTLQTISYNDLQEFGTFVNRSIKEWYFIKNGDKRIKGGLVEFMFESSNIIAKASKNNIRDGRLLWGKALNDEVQKRFQTQRKLRVEIFNDYLPNDECYITVDKKHLDIFGQPVGKLRVYSHPQNQKIAKLLASKSQEVLEHMGASDIQTTISNLPPPNLIAGGCRFGDDDKTSVLNKHCQSHDIPNLFVADASFMPTGGSVPYTWSIYANALRVGEYIDFVISN
jgi:choline dehydrogenase-like flavoprotein